jgi:hypothetical protein
MKRQFLSIIPVTFLLVISPDTLLADTNNVALVDRDEMRKQSQRDYEALRRQKEIEIAEIMAKKSEDNVNAIRTSVGLQTIHKEEVTSVPFSKLWHDWIGSKARLIDALHRQEIANSMSEAELTAAAKLYPNLSRSPSGSETGDIAQKLIGGLSTEVEIAKITKQVLEDRLGITNDAIALDYEALRALDVAESDLAIKYGIEKSIKKRTEETQQSAGADFEPAAGPKSAQP